MNPKQEVMKTIDRLVKLLDARDALLDELGLTLLDNATVLEIAGRLADILKLIKEIKANTLCLEEMAEAYRKEKSSVKRLERLKKLQEENEFYLSHKESMFLTLLIEILEEMVLRALKDNKSSFQATVQKAPKSVAQKINESRLSSRVNNQNSKKANNSL